MKYEEMDIYVAFADATVEQIEAHIEREVNKRDAVTLELLALNALRDRKVSMARRDAAVAKFREEHGEDPLAQVIRPDSAVAAPTVDPARPAQGLFGKLFGKT